MDDMASSQVLRIRLHNQEGEYVLVEVTSNGPSPLDLRLLATEGEFPYVAAIKQSRIGKFRAKTSPIDDAQWETILLSTLLYQRYDGQAAVALENLETLAEIREDRLEITFRRNISGITQRLGAIALKKDEDQEINTVAWAVNAVSRSRGLEKEVQGLQKKYNEQGETIRKLNKQLDELIEAKKEHENSLLQKFRELLNAKKLKIRDQQRLLAGAKVDPTKAAQIQTARASSPTTSRPPTSTRPNKRKSTAAPEVSPSDSEGDGFEKMAVDRKPAPDNLDDNIEATTPDKSDLDATEDEAEEDDDDDLDAVAPSQSTRSGQGAKGKAIETATAPKQPAEIARSATPPPRRELPFAQRPSGRGEQTENSGAGGTKVAQDWEATGDGIGVDDDDGAETSDDEL